MKVEVPRTYAELRGEIEESHVNERPTKKSEIQNSFQRSLSQLILLSIGCLTGTKM